LSLTCTQMASYGKIRKRKLLLLKGGGSCKNTENV
jgi:hypothetical protein